ncbi:hypothetical protein ACN27F_13965 [Solwaraspora sp. WMMB335]|uniref:hypothetical protein n=1 Tax=Solwaraspora sp. WMMB335 TaxID=3404118 RepID=UPI003B94B67B
MPDESAVPSAGHRSTTNDHATTPEQPLIDEAVRKAAVAWISVAGAAARAVWCLPADGALYVVTGPHEQPADGLEPGVPATVTLRGDHGGQIVTWPAAVSRVEPDSAEWESVAPQVAGKRLNTPDSLPDLVRRWATECRLFRLAPVGTVLAAGPTLPDGSLAAPPRPATVTRATRRPFRLHRVRRR